MTANHLLRTCLTCALLITPAIGSGFQSAAPAAPARQTTKQDAGADKKPIERLKAWPKLESKSKTSKEVARLSRANTEAMGEEALAALQEIGAGAAPLLIKALGKERKEEGRERLVAVLDEITGAAHTRLMAPSFKDSSEAVRLWSLARCAALPDAGVRDAAEAAYASSIDPKRRNKAGSSEIYLAALCATASGSLNGFLHIEARAAKSWKNCSHEVRIAIEQVRGPEAAALLLPRLADAPRKEAVTLMRLLAGCGDPSCASKIAPFLDNSDNSLRVAAINALRGVVDGDLPLERLPVFRAIEVAAEWKARL